MSHATVTDGIHAGIREHDPTVTISRQRRPARSFSLRRVNACGSDVEPHERTASTTVSRRNAPYIGGDRRGCASPPHCVYPTADASASVRLSSDLTSLSLTSQTQTQTQPSPSALRRLWSGASASIGSGEIQALYGATSSAVQSRPSPYAISVSVSACN